MHKRIAEADRPGSTHQVAWRAMQDQISTQELKLITTSGRICVLYRDGAQVLWIGQEDLSSTA
jgi:hypothetical protein